jgi:DNA-binding IclR family transcriptional regulator
MAIQSVQRALSILTLFSKSRLSYKLTEIANALDLRITTVHGIVSTLEQNGFLRQNPRTREYLLGTKLYELGAYFAAELEINKHASDHVQRLARRTHSTARVGIWDGNTVLITLFAFPEGMANTVHKFGPRIVPYCTAMGKAILAFMSEKRLLAYLQTEQLVRHTRHTLTDRKAILADLAHTRERGYAVNRSELSMGRAGIAVPIWGAGQVLEGALSIPGKEDEILGENLSALANDLLHTGTEISQSMGYILGGPGGSFQR